MFPAENLRDWAGGKVIDPDGELAAAALVHGTFWNIHSLPVDRHPATLKAAGVAHRDVTCRARTGDPPRQPFHCRG
jgi:hypothetical protein